MFAGPGPEVQEDEFRNVSLALLLSSDQSLEKVTLLNIGEGMWRDSYGAEWHSWTVKKRNSK